MGERGRNPAAPKFCDACFTGDYPIRLTDFAGRDQPAQLSLLAERA
jgi:amidophosphoribosyltransferase